MLPILSFTAPTAPFEIGLLHRGSLHPAAPRCFGQMPTAANASHRCPRLYSFYVGISQQGTFWQWGRRESQRVWWAQNKNVTTTRQTRTHVESLVAPCVIAQWPRACMLPSVTLRVHMLIHSACKWMCVSTGGGGARAKEGPGLPCSCTSGLYIRPLINPEWRPGSDRLTRQAPVQDTAWFITSELQPALIYFGLRKGESGRGCV